MKILLNILCTANVLRKITLLAPFCLLLWNQVLLLSDCVSAWERRRRRCKNCDRRGRNQSQAASTDGQTETLTFGLLIPSGEHGPKGKKRGKNPRKSRAAVSQVSQFGITHS